MVSIPAHTMRRLAALIAVVLASLAAAVLPARGATQESAGFSLEEVVGAGHQFFGEISEGLGSLIETAFSSYGLPDGYILGEEGSGAFFAGASYGEGTLYVRGGETHVYWQGPSIGFDFGGDAARTMILVYNLPQVDAIYDRFFGVDGSAYIVGGLGMTALTNGEQILVRVRSGVGGRLSINVNYLKFTAEPTWNPF